MKILFTFIYLPHLSESGVFIDVIKEFANQGHDVYVVTPLITEGKQGIRFESGIKVLRFKTDQLTRNSSNIKKGVAYLKYPFQIIYAINKYFSSEKFDLIVAHSLPPEFGLVINYLKWKYRVKFYLMLCEYIWQDSVSLGFIKDNGLICRYYKWLEKITINAADYIGSPSQGNIDFTLKYYPWAIDKNIHILHYSQTLHNGILISEIDKEEIKKKYKLNGKFIAIYGGNISIAQKIENIVELAESCLEYKEIVFLLLGRGPLIEAIKKDVVLKRLNNIIFIDFLPKSEYEKLLSICDVGLVSLNEKLAVPNIPSKTISYFSFSKPIIASIDYNTDYGKYLEDAKAGLWSYAGDNDKFKENLLSLYNSLEEKERMGQNAFKFYLENMTPLSTYKTMMQYINF